MKQAVVEAVGDGLKLVTNPIPDARSAAVAILVPSGSRHESDATAGWSHFLEHLLFKGTDQLDSAALDRLFDSLGGEMNAMTSRESTVLVNRVASERLEQAVSTMAAMCLRPALGGVDSEREIILEEMAMIEDDPSEKVFDHLSEEMFPGDPLGRPVIGFPDAIAEATSGKLREFHEKAYLERELIVSIAGAVDHQAAISMVEPFSIRRTVEGAQTSDPLIAAGHATSIKRDSEQVHICLASTGPGLKDEARFPLRVLDQILGGGGSSRLFRILRDELGLAYETHSFIAATSDVSEFGVYVATRPDNASRAAQALGEVVVSLAGTICEDELEHAKVSLASRMRLAGESSLERAFRSASDLALQRNPLTDEEIERKLMDVTLDDVESLACDLLAADRLVGVSVGPSETAAQEALIAAGGQS